MLAKVKLALRIVADAFDSELLDLIESGIADIRVVGANFDVDVVTDESGNVQDYVIEDAKVRTAVITYCKLNFGQPDNYAQLEQSYWQQKAQLRENRDYGPQ